MYQEAGICLGPDYVRRGFGRQILQCLMEHAKELGAKEFVCCAREQNTASRGLITSMGFEQFKAETRVDERDGSSYIYLRYRRTLS